jgi:hypothetical protein
VFTWSGRLMVVESISHGSLRLVLINLGNVIAEVDTTR